MIFDKKAVVGNFTKVTGKLFNGIVFKVNLHALSCNRI